MNSTTDNTTRQTTREPGRRGRRAEAGTAAWEDAVRLQRRATPDHADFYALAGELVRRCALDDLTRCCAGRSPATPRPSGTGAARSTTTPARSTRRCGCPAVEASWTASAPPGRRARANPFWSAIGHIGTRTTATRRRHRPAAGLAGHRARGDGEVSS